MKKLLLLWLPMMLFACSQDDVVVDNPCDLETGFNENPYFISQKEAVSIAEQSFDDFYDGTRSAKNIEKITEVSSRLSTRAEGDSKGWYIINYEEKGGFAVVSNDRRIPSLLALSNYGHLEMSDTIRIKLLARFFNGVENTLDALGPVVRDSLEGYPMQPITPEPYPGTTPTPKKETVCKIDPLIIPKIAKWHQGNPYNIYCPKVGGENCLVGCSPLAVGMVLTYYEYPSKWYWSGIKSGNTVLAASLLATLGSSQYLSSNYGVNGTSTQTKKCRTAFEKLDYNVAEYKTFGSTSYLDLSSHGPLFINSTVNYWSYNTKLGQYESKQGGHSNVIDGCNIYRIENVGQGAINYPGEKVPEWFYHYYYHCRLGWGGYCDGYYVWLDESNSLYNGSTPGGPTTFKNMKYFYVTPNR